MEKAPIMLERILLKRNVKVRKLEDTYKKGIFIPERSSSIIKSKWDFIFDLYE
jgi:hypothetical protein